MIEEQRESFSGKGAFRAKSREETRTPIGVFAIEQRSEDEERSLEAAASIDESKVIVAESKEKTVPEESGTFPAPGTEGPLGHVSTEAALSASLTEKVTYFFSDRSELRQRRTHYETREGNEISSACADSAGSAKHANRKRHERKRRKADAVEASRVKRAKRRGDKVKCSKAKIQPKRLIKRRGLNPKLRVWLKSRIGATRVARIRVSRRFKRSRLRQVASRKAPCMPRDKRKGPVSYNGRPLAGQRFRADIRPEGHGAVSGE